MFCQKEQKSAQIKLSLINNLVQLWEKDFEKDERNQWSSWLQSMRVRNNFGLFSAFFPFAVDLTFLNI